MTGGDGEATVTMRQLMAHHDWLMETRLKVARLEEAAANQREMLSATSARQSNFERYVSSRLAVHDGRMRDLEARADATDKDVSRLQETQGQSKAAIERLEELPHHLQRQADIIKYALAGLLIGGAIANQHGLFAITRLLKLFGLNL